MTDRGRVLILVGAPYRITRTSDSPTTSTHQSGFVGAGTADNARGSTLPTEVWYYEKNRVPAFSGLHEFEIGFVDYYGSNQYELGRSPRTDVAGILKRAAESFLVSPDLTEPPSFATSVSAGQKPAAPVALAPEIQAAIDAWLTGSKSSVARLTSGNFVTGTGTTFTALQWFVPAADRASVEGKATVFGLIRDSGGQIVETWTDDAGFFDSGAELWFDRSFELPAGRYDGVVGVVRDGDVSVLSDGSFEANALEASVPAVSPLLLVHQDLRPCRSADADGSLVLWRNEGRAPWRWDIPSGGGLLVFRGASQSRTG